MVAQLSSPDAISNRAQRSRDHLAVFTTLAAQRQGTHKETRLEVKGSARSCTVKGTGGSWATSATLYKGGGTIFDPSPRLRFPSWNRKVKDPAGGKCTIYKGEGNAIVIVEDLTSKTKTFVDA